MLNPYEQPSPYATLGIAPDASAVEIRDRYNELLRQLQEAGGDNGQRAQRLQEIEWAYNQLRVASKRAAVDFFLLDPQIGQKRCVALAKELLSPDIKVEGVTQPKGIRMTHAAILPELQQYFIEPPLSDLHPQPMETDEAPGAGGLPGPLAIVFDC